MSERKAEELLPWYVNGTLDADETSLVESELSESQDLRDQLALLQMVSSQTKEESLPEASELGWRRLQREILKAQEDTGANQAPESPAVVRGIKDAPRNKEWFKPALAVAVVLVVALQIGILNKPVDQSNIQLLSGSAAWQKSPHHLIQLEFTSEATWQQMHMLLEQADAQLVEGPSSLGIVRIAVPESSEAFSSEVELVSWLRNQSIVTHVALEE